jgi:hypothetical protein
MNAHARFVAVLTALAIATVGAAAQGKSDAAKDKDNHGTSVSDVAKTAGTATKDAAKATGKGTATGAKAVGSTTAKGAEVGAKRVANSPGKDDRKDKKK